MHAVVHRRRRREHPLRPRHAPLELGYCEFAFWKSAHPGINREQSSSALLRVEVGFFPQIIASSSGALRLEDLRISVPNPSARPFDPGKSWGLSWHLVLPTVQQLGSFMDHANRVHKAIREHSGMCAGVIPYFSLAGSAALASTSPSRYRVIRPPTAPTSALFNLDGVRTGVGSGCENNDGLALLSCFLGEHLWRRSIERSTRKACGW